MTSKITNKNITSHKSCRRPEQYVIILICMLSSIAFSLVCQLSIANTSYNDTSLSLAETILGDIRIAISANLYTQADTYFHRGVPHTQKRAFKSDPFQLIHDVVRPITHDHLSGARDIQEIMPWLDMAIRANPQNLESYLVAAYWLSREANLNEQALQVLERAQQNNPYSCQVQLSKGQLLLNMGEHDLAKQAFSAALAFWHKNEDPTNKYDLLDKAQALQYRSLLYENSGRIDEAIKDLQEFLTISPHNSALKKRLINLQNGVTPQAPAHYLLASLQKRHDKRRRKCSHEEHNHEHDEHSEECKHGSHSDIKDKSQR